MKHFLTTEDWPREDLEQLLVDADRLRGLKDQSLKGKTAALIFFNPSLRTRASFQVAMIEMGGNALVLDTAGTWSLEVEPGAMMDQGAEEHVKEAARVLSTYVDVICIRCFPKFQDWSVDRQDRLLHAFAEYATVPIVNMETIVHPCQELAHMLAVKDRLGAPDGKKYVLTWTYHPKPLNTAVANSSLLIATKFGMDVTLLCPTEEYLLDPRFMSASEENVKRSGGSLTISHDPQTAYRDADVVYAKSWGALPYFGRWEEEKPIRDAHRHFRVDEDKMALTNNALFSHCLPLRRNVKVTDAVADSPQSMIIEEAANRLPVQKAVLQRLLKGN
ncbi:ornithine carbamoyltransferase [Parvularcula bermudensis HTCC2503]|uniref:N-acetylornithine carbamoyltransferase n=1 Tax=Parvularcula bermudensis (strain ATCC BAA-594 / HTCC2503 / KCTC 12087) TaxID=314260 RepID=E0TIE3_PARBH|nr:N-acetylornithine carbamoyltransferase [Parvularcula bermudensis]ADM10262.1 ornithine carbamoyltransferase [Parvularcula bermudensis HTCC2503]